MRGDGKGTRLMMLDNLTENPSHRMSTASQKLKTYPFVLHGTDHKIPYNCRLLEKKISPKLPVALAAEKRVISETSVAR